MFNKIKKFFTLYRLNKDKEQTAFYEQVWNEKRPLIEKQNEIETERENLLQERRKLKPLPWSKLFLLFLFANFTVLEIFTGWVTIQSFSISLAVGMTPDFTPLVTLIGAVIGQTLAYGIYSMKSKAENTVGGITYEMARWQMEQGEYCDNFGDQYGGGGLG